MSLYLQVYIVDNYLIKICHYAMRVSPSCFIRKSQLLACISLPMM